MSTDRWSQRLRPGLRTKLGLFAGALTALVVAMTAWLATRIFESGLREMVEQSTVGDAEELRGVLEEQMISGDRAALNRLVLDIGHGPDVAWVAVVDARGRVHVSSDRGSVGGWFPADAPEMAIVHAASPDRPARTETLLRKGCSVLRTVTPMPNLTSCRKCHPATTPVLGALVIDRSLDPLRRAVKSSTAQLAIGGVTTLLVLLGSLGFAVEHVVLRPLSRLRGATRRLGAADFAGRTSDGSTDEIGDLSRDFDAMAEKLQVALTASASERKQLADLLDGMSDGVLLLDPDLRTVKVNEAFHRRLGPDCGPLERLPYRTLVVRAGLEPGAEPLPAERALASGELQKQAVCIRQAADDRFEEIYAQPLRLHDGRVVAVVEVWRDITDRKELEAGLEQSERLAAIGTLASSVAHEVGNPLASIITVVDGVLSRLDQEGELPSPGEARENLQLIRRQVFRCRSVTQRLLGFARAPTDSLTTVDTAGVVEETLALVAAQVRTQRVEVRRELAPCLLATVPGQHLEHVFLNVVLNALKVMPAGGVLTVKGWAEGGAVLVRFSDTGPGIPEEVRRKLFQPFVRGRDSRSGNGLGLYICHTLVARCQGSIDVASEAGQWCTFTIRVPAAGGAHDRPVAPAARA